MAHQLPTAWPCVASSTGPWHLDGKEAVACTLATPRLVTRLTTCFVTVLSLGLREYISGSKLHCFSYMLYSVWMHEKVRCNWCLLPTKAELLLMGKGFDRSDLSPNLLATSITP